MSNVHELNSNPPLLLRLSHELVNKLFLLVNLLNHIYLTNIIKDTLQNISWTSRHYLIRNMNEVIQQHLLANLMPISRITYAFTSIIYVKCTKIVEQLSEFWIHLTDTPSITSLVQNNTIVKKLQYISKNCFWM